MAKKIKDQFGRDTGTWEPGIIYELGYELDGQWQPFYVGESYKKDQRLYRHRSCARSGDTSLHVYDYIRNELDAKNIEWTMQVVAEYGAEGPTDQEDEQIMRRLVEGYELRNKKKGNANWKEKFEEEWNEKLRVAEDMRQRGFTSYKKYREQLDYEQRERQIAEANEARRQQEETERQSQEAHEAYLAAMSALELEQHQRKLEREAKRQAIIAEAQERAQASRLEREKQDRINRIKQQQQAERAQADAAARAERIRIETERLMAEERQQQENQRAVEQLKDPSNLRRNHQLADIQENARLLALYIQTIEETKPNSPVLPEAYRQLQVWRQMKAAL